MNARVFLLRYRSLAFCLSLLALCAALLAPVSVLAEEMRAGKWTGLCNVASDTSHEAPEEASGHCDLCALPGLLSGLPAAGLALNAEVPPLWLSAVRSSAFSADPWQRPAIRAPPAAA